MSDCKVFYSWQSDLPGACNRNLIEAALREAIAAIRNDGSINLEPVIDRDTQGTPGSPDIAQTIFQKIDEAKIFVCDVSIINSDTGRNGRLTPNPNVLVELGYAIRALGPERIILVMNSVFGTPEQLPFDLRMRRITVYTSPEATEERAFQRRDLKGKLKAALEVILRDIEVSTVAESTATESPIELAKVAIQEASHNQAALIRQFMAWLVKELMSLSPDLSQGVADELLVEAINQSQGLVIAFTEIAEAIVINNSKDAAIAVYREFEKLVQLYYPPPEFSGAWNRNQFDFYKFIGHELFVTLFGMLIRERRWDIVADILEEELYVNNAYGRNAQNIRFTYVSQAVRLLIERKNRLQLDRISLHADLLNERHTNGRLGEIFPMQNFMDSDSFLYFRSFSQFASPSDPSSLWSPWSKVYMSEASRYLIEAYQIRYANQLCRPLAVNNLLDLKSLMSTAVPEFRKLFYKLFTEECLYNFDPSNIGTR